MADSKHEDGDRRGRSQVAGKAPGILVPSATRARARPVWLLANGDAAGASSGLTAAQQDWIAAQGAKAVQRKATAIPDAHGGLAGYAFGLPAASPRDCLARTEILMGLVPQQVPSGLYAIEGRLADPELAAISWGLGAYRFGRYKSGEAGGVAQLVTPKGVDHARASAIIDAIGLGRDLINTPAGDMGPAELEAATRALARQHGAKVSCIAGDDLLAKNFPMIHAVGRASASAPRLIDLRWQPAAPKTGRLSLVLVGKGVCFDTGGLDIKPSSGMLLMKKDMGGAATALALAAMIMALDLDVRLRVLIPAVENAISGNAFRPGDVLVSRAGRTVEIGNTDAEGRLVLADALALADEEKPDTVMSFATLTGAARVALGPDLPPLYADDAGLADGLMAAGSAVGDPLWRMPFWDPYEAMLDSPVADMNNVSDGPFAGSVTAALFLRRFVRTARRYAHFDIYGWRPAPRPLGPKGGEPQAARAVLAWLEAELAKP